MKFLNILFVWCLRSRKHKHSSPSARFVIRREQRRRDRRSKTMSENESTTTTADDKSTAQPTKMQQPNESIENADNQAAPEIRLLYDYRCLERPFYTKLSDHFRKHKNANQTMPVFPNPAVKVNVLNQDSVKTTIREKCDVDQLTGEIMFPDYMLTVEPTEAIANLEHLLAEIIENYCVKREDGRLLLVKYTDLRDDNFFEKNQMALTDLSKTKLDNLGEEKLKPFFINLYNLLVIHQIVLHTNRRLKSVLDIRGFTRAAAYRVGNCTYTLDDIKHGILRGNRPHPECTQRHFTYNDRRLVYSIRKRDPRIHFALMKGCKSSPKLRVWTSEMIDQRLNEATAEFCNENVRITSHGKVCLHRFFDWYGLLDFGKSNKAILKWILQYLPKEKTDAIRIISRKWSSTTDIQVDYKIYDWTLNSL